MFNKYDRRTEVQSIYCYKGTEVYKNKFNIRDADMLSHLESDLTSNRLLELSENPIKGRYGTAHFLNIHKYIFQDIYPFAGKIREEDIWKGSTFFCKCDYIRSNLDSIFAKIKSEKYLADLSEQDFISKLAYYMSELNIIHPFREGNGRAIREYIRILALRNDYCIDWYKTSGEDLLEAAIKAVDFDYSYLENCLVKVIEKKK